MIWQVIYRCVLETEALVTTAAMNSNLYEKECLKKRVLPFIRQHRVSVKFWTNLDLCHCSKDTQKCSQDNNIDSIPKKFNPPNCPELRHIEIFCDIVNEYLFCDSGSALTVEKMYQKCNKHASKVNKSTVQLLMGHIKTNMRQIFRSQEL
jgi:hypothetical protein